MEEEKTKTRGFVIRVGGSREVSKKAAKSLEESVHKASKKKKESDV